MIRFRASRMAMAGLIAVTAAGISAPGPARADSGGAFVGGLVGGVILKTILDETRGQREHPGPRRTKTTRAPADPAVTEYWRNIQSALNSAGFHSGRPDGVPGRNTRSAIRDFQISIGAEPTRTLKPSELAVLQNRAFPGYSPAAGIAPVVATTTAARTRDPWEGDYSLDCMPVGFQCWWTVEKHPAAPSYQVTFRMADRFDAQNVHCQVQAVADPDPQRPGGLVAFVPGAGVVRFQKVELGNMNVEQGQGLGCDRGYMSGHAEIFGDM